MVSPRPGLGPSPGLGLGLGLRTGNISSSRTMEASCPPQRAGGGSYLGLGPALNFLVLPGVLVVLVLGALVWSPSRSCSDDSS